jgi:hypothetical protein
VVMVVAVMVESDRVELLLNWKLVLIENGTMLIGRSRYHVLWSTVRPQHVTIQIRDTKKLVS